MTRQHVTSAREVMRTSYNLSQYSTLLSGQDFLDGLQRRASFPCRSSVFIHRIGTPNRPTHCDCQSSSIRCAKPAYLPPQPASRLPLTAWPTSTACLFPFHPRPANRRSEDRSVARQEAFCSPLPRLFPPLLAIYTWFWMGFGAR